MGNKIDSNGTCMECTHYKICKNEIIKQNLISKLIKLDFDTKPFEIIVKCPDYSKSIGRIK